MSKSLDVRYHYAHIATQGSKVSTVDLIDPIKGTIRINDSILEGGAIFVRFSSKAIKSIFDEKSGIEKLDVDLYSGIIGLNNQAYQYVCKAGYYANFSGRISYQSTEDFGYVIESPPRLAVLFIKKLAFVESFQEGKVKIHVSSFDLNGYVDFLFAEGILTLARIAEPTPLPPFKDMVIKELQEQKDEPAIPSTSETMTPEITPQIHAVSLESVVEITGASHAEDVSLHT